MEMADGEEIDSESGPISLHLEPVDSSGRIHIESPDYSGEDGFCPITGDTYRQKDVIKKLPYGDGGTKWTGETWVVSEEQTANLAATLSIAAVDVTIHSDAVGSDPEWGYYHEEEQEEESVPTGVEVGGPSEANESAVMASWLSDLVELGSYDSKSEYQDRFGVNLFYDADTGGGHELLADTDGVAIFDSRKACPP